MADIDRAYTVTSIQRSEGWVVIGIKTEGCSDNQIICITQDEESICYGTIDIGDVIYLRFLD